MMQKCWTHTILFKSCLAININLKKPTLRANIVSASGKISVFISHCGYFGLQEAVFNGVPIAAMPMFGDQFYNAKRIVDKGLGVRMPGHKEATADTICSALSHVLQDQRFVWHKFWNGADS